MDLTNIPVTLSNGSIIMLEIPQPDDEQNVTRNPINFADSFNTIKTFVRDLVDPLIELNLGKVSIELGLGFSIESGKIISVLMGASTTSSLKIKVEFDSK